MSATLEHALAEASQWLLRLKQRGIDLTSQAHRKTVHEAVELADDPSLEEWAAAAHAIITPVCRENRGDEGAWAEAVARAKAEYDAILRGWAQQPVQPTLHLVLRLERPAAEGAS